MGYRYAIAPQPGEYVAPLHEEIPGAQKCIVHLVQAYQPDTHTWAVSLAYEQNANTRDTHIKASRGRARWEEVELP